MARGRHGRRRASLDAPAKPRDRDRAAPGAPLLDPGAAAASPAEVRDAIEFHWKNLSLDLKRFLLRRPHELSLRAFVDFWTAPSRRENTNPNIAASICGCSWYLALNYMSIGQIVEARALILNGCFLQQCYNKPIEEIAAVADSLSGESFREQLPYFTDGLLAISSPERMAAFLRNKVSSDYQRRMSFATQTTQTKQKVRDYVDQISNDWGDGGGRRQEAARRRATLAGPPDAATIEIRLVDGRTQEETTVRYSVAMTMKSLFKKYAEDRGVSLRQLRFSYKGRTLFLSSVGNKTFQDLDIGHGDAIVVTHTAPVPAPKPEEGSASDGASSSADESKPRAGASCRRTCRRASWAGPSAVDEEERCKLEHSSRLSRVLAEAAPQLARRRQALHALNLSRVLPKAKGPRRQAPAAVAPLPPTDRTSAVGGKAGVPFYAVRVGAAEHLHRAGQRPTPGGRAHVVDLHGLTRGEALARLDETLPGWVDAAMRGAYPWVIQATIVCGGGNQVLAEVVEGWIKDHDNVAKAPKFSRRRSV